MYLEVYINSDKIDLYEGEGITINSSVLNIQDITKNTTDYSRDFTVPASAANNKLFKHYYDADIENGFDGRVAHNAYIYLGGVLFRFGKLLLSNVKIKNGKPESYALNFWGNIKGLKDTFNEDKLTDLDLSAYDHNYTSANVELGLRSSLFSGAVKYTPLVKRQYYYNSDASDLTNETNLVNIAYNSASGDNGILWNELRPSLNLLKVIEAIESKYEITFSRHFFGRTEISSIYLWLNNKSTDDIGTVSAITDWDGGDAGYMNQATDEATYTLLWSGTSGFNKRLMKLTWTVAPEAGFGSVPYTARVLVDGEVHTEKSMTGTDNLVAVLIGDGDVEVQFEIETNLSFEYACSLSQQEVNGYQWPTDTEQVVTSSSNVLSSGVIVSAALPDMKVIDFVKGLASMFKLVIIPTDIDEYYVNDSVAYYKEGVLRDLTKYIKSDSITVSRGNVLKSIEYKFKEPATILAKQFYLDNEKYYGNEEAILTDENGEQLTGEPSTINLPFEQVIYERLTDEQGGITSVQYGAIVDQNINPVNIAAHLHYVNTADIGTKTVAFIDDSGVKNELTGYINFPSHNYKYFSVDEDKFSLLFSQEFNTYNGELIQATLYDNYHRDYVESVFDVRRRNFAFDAVIPNWMLIDIKLNDIIVINENIFRLNNFTVNLATGETKLNLSSIFNLPVAYFTTAKTEIVLSSEAQDYAAYITNLYPWSYQKYDDGDGFDWVSVDDDENGNIVFTVAVNTGGSRSCRVRIVNTESLDEIYFTIVQLVNNNFTIDTTDITIDTSLITI